MAKSVQKVHWDIILEFMENHPELAKGQFSGPTGRANQKRLWQELCSTLNAQGFGQKEIQKWQKVSFY